MMKQDRSTDRLLTELNNDSLTDRERAEILVQILDMEFEKPEAEADMDLIRECFDYLELLDHSDAEIEARKAQLPDRLQRTYQKAAEMENGANDPLVSEIRPVARKRRFRKAAIAAAIVAAALLIAATSLTVIARVNGYDNPLEWIWDEYRKLSNGEQITIDGVTIIRYDDNVIYPDIETWLKEEKPDILFPSVLPDGIQVREVDQSYIGEGKVELRILFDPPKVSFMAINDYLDMFDPREEDMEILEMNGYRVGIFSEPEDTHLQFYAHFIADGYAYSITAQDRDTMLLILENLKKSGA